MMKKTYIYPSTEVICLQSTALLGDPMADISGKEQPGRTGSLGKQKIPGVFVVDW